MQPLWKTEWRFLRKLKIEPLYNTTIPLMGVYLKNMKTLIQKIICTPMFIAVLFTIAKIWKQNKCSSRDKQIKYTIQYYSAIKKE